MKKVFCDNCKYFSNDIINSKCKKILEKEKIFYKDTVTTERHYFIRKMRIWSQFYTYNKDNNCKYYKRKWWKYLTHFYW